MAHKRAHTHTHTHTHTEIMQDTDTGYLELAVLCSPENVALCMGFCINGGLGMVFIYRPSLAERYTHMKHSSHVTPCRGIRHIEGGVVEQKTMLSHASHTVSVYTY